MLGELDNLPVNGGTDTPQPSDTDTRTDWDYYDPDEDQDTVEPPDQNAAASETDESEVTQEAVTADETETETAPDEDKAEPEDVLVPLPTGEKVPLKELTNGYMRQADYSRKTAVVSQQTKAVAAQATEFKAITDAFTDFLAANIPDAPDVQLAYTNPGAYTAQEAAHRAAVAQLQQIMEAGKRASSVVDQVNNVDLQRTIEAENQMLAEKAPMTTDRKGREAFFGMATQAAMDVGFSQADMQGQTDHRLYVLAHWAAKGMKAEAARSKAQAKVATVPPVSPAKKAPVNVNSNRDAMSRLNQSGSIRDAMRVDFD